MRMATAGQPKTSHLERTAEEPRERVRRSYIYYWAHCEQDTDCERIQELHQVRISRVDQVNERIRLFQLDLVQGDAKVCAHVSTCHSDRLN
jgi:uncharacterized protein